MSFYFYDYNASVSMDSLPFSLIKISRVMLENKFISFLKYCSTYPGAFMFKIFDLLSVHRYHGIGYSTHNFG